MAGRSILVSVTGTQALAAHIARLNGEATSALAKGLTRACEEIITDAKEHYVPVDTGALKNSINANGGGSDWRVDSPASYSVFQEFGTSRMAARPYMIPALERVAPSFKAALRRIA